MRANRFVSRTINNWLHGILSENQGLENLHNFGRGLKKFPQLPVGLCLLCFTQKTLSFQQCISSVTCTCTTVQVLTYLFFAD